MHSFIYPSQDTYISNAASYADKNLGIDELLEIRANSQLYRDFTSYQSASVSQSYSVLTNLVEYSGSVAGYLSGSESGLGSLRISSSVNIVGSYHFTGTITGSIDATSGTIISSSLSSYSGYLSGSASGSLAGKWSGIICYSTGSAENFTGKIQGDVNGIETIYSPTVKFLNKPLLSRSLLKFDVSSISQSIATGKIVNTGSLKFNLKLYVTQEKNLPLEYSIFAYPISQSWQPGNGRYEFGGSNLGTSWQYRDFADTTSGSYWYYPLPTSSVYPTGDYLRSASYSSDIFKMGGGNWYYSVPTNYTASSAYCSSKISASNSLTTSQDFNFSAGDLNVDVTNIVNSWICGCIPNNGIILLSSLETSTAPLGENGILRFFSRDTNTIYVPFIDANWDDSVYITGSLPPVDGGVPYTVTVKNLSKDYKAGSIPRLDVFARAKNPLKNFVKDYQMNQYLTSSLLPSGSYYSIKDNESEETLIEFSDSSKLSCDGKIHYFYLDTTAFPQERFYRILIKVNDLYQSQIFDNGYIFKVTR